MFKLYRIFKRYLSARRRKNTKKPPKPFFDVSSFRTALFIFLCVVCVWGTWSLKTYRDYLKFEEKPDTGKLGDSYGAINSFFSALAFAGLIYTIALQRKELAETRQEFIKQNTTFKRQRFESTFFSMITIHFNNLNGIKFNNEAGVEVFAKFLDNLYSKMRANVLPNQPEQLIDIDINVAVVQFQTYYVSSYLMKYTSIYIQSINALFNSIAKNKLNQKADKRYKQILKSYLSSFEREFLFYIICMTKVSNSGEKTSYPDLAKALNLDSNLKELIRLSRKVNLTGELTKESYTALVK